MVKHEHGHGHAGHRFFEQAPKVRQVLIVTLVLNVAVAFAKVAYGYVIGSIGMVSDGFHSLFDGVSNVVGLVGIWIAAHPPDKEHPYGHRKFETFFTIIIAVMIFGTCFQMLRRAYDALFYGRGMAVATDLSFVVMGATIAVNVFVMIYESRKGREYGSEFLTADAMHTRSDILASVAVVTGLIFTRAGYPFADTAAGLVVTFFIARIGIMIVMRASETLMDAMRLDPLEVGAAACSVQGVRGCHGVRTRGPSSHIYMDLHILVDAQMTTGEAHRVAGRVETALKGKFEGLNDVVVHVEPVGDGGGGDECCHTEDKGED